MEKKDFHEEMSPKEKTESMIYGSQKFTMAYNIQQELLKRCNKHHSSEDDLDTDRKHGEKDEQQEPSRYITDKQIMLTKLKVENEGEGQC